MLFKGGDYMHLSAHGIVRRNEQGVLCIGTVHVESIHEILEHMIDQEVIVSISEIEDDEDSEEENL